MSQDSQFTRPAYSRRGFLTVTAASAAVPLSAMAQGLGAAPEVAAPDDPALAMAVQLQVNDQDYRLALDPRTSLLDALRDHIGLTGAKKGCDHGQCGACTVLLGGQRVLSCLTLAVAVGERPVTTIEGLTGPGDELHPVQQAFIDHDAFQCGYCTPGQILSAVGCIAEGHAASDDDIREYMSGNLCRCAAYPNIVAAVRQARDALESAGG